MHRSERVGLTDRGLARVAAVALVGALAIMATSCASGGDEAVDSSTAESTTEADPTTSTTSAQQALARGRCPSVAPQAQPDPDRPVYVAELTVDLEAGRVQGTVEITFTPDLPIDRVVLRLWPNAPRPAASGTVATIDQLTVDGKPAVVDRPDPTTWVVPLGREHLAGAAIELSMALTLDVPGAARDRVARTGDAMRLGSFLPLLPWEPGVGWAEDPPTALFAEATTSPTADFDVTLSVPEGYDVLATGVSGGTDRWRAEAVRDFAASVGRFELASASVDAPEPVEITVGVDESLADSPNDYLDRVVASMVEFSARFGAYPWPALTVAVTPDLGGGIEMPMHIMQGPDSLGRTTPHEVAHMWFYSLVGNNQARDPWIDEGLASYAEATFEDTIDEFRERLSATGAVGALGEPLTYWADRERDYYPGVYVQGAVAVADLGPEQLVDCALRHYVAEHAYDLVDATDLVDAFSFVFPEAATALSTRGVPPP